MTHLSFDLATELNGDVINEAFEIARSNRTGILSTVGFGVPRLAQDGYKLNWLDMQVGAAGSNVVGAVTDTATSITVTTGTGGSFRKGMTLLATGSDELIYVSAVSGDTLTVARGFGSTTAEAITDGTSITIESVGREENSLAASDGIYQPYSVENYYQTMDANVSMSRRALATYQHGNTNDLAFQVSEQIRQLAIQMDRVLIRGRKAIVGSGDDQITFTGGMRYFIDQAPVAHNVDGAGPLTLDMIDELNATLVKAGGSTDTIAVGINKARELNALVAANYNSNRLADWSSDQGAVNMLPSDLPLAGSINRIVLDTNLADDELVVYNSGSISIIPMASGNADASGAWRTLDATQKGQDGQSVRIIGDFGMEVRQSKTHMGRLYGLD